MRDVESTSRLPHPLGSPEHARVRAYLVDRLETLGLEVEVQTETIVERFPRYTLAARVHNIVARRPGLVGGDGAILLAAHYDTRPTTPGAGDDSSGIAVILELLRALEVEGRLDRDLVVLLSDGEELGLLGARAFVDQHRWAESVELVLNFEARGNSGASVMFETGFGNDALVRLFAESAPYPMASSLTYDVYRRMPNDTDFTVFKDAGWTGYNFAFIEGYSAYHTALDRADRLDPRSLQQEGANALALLRRLDGSDPQLSPKTAVYFNPIGDLFVVYSRATAILLLVVACVVWLAAAFLGSKRGWCTPGGLLHAFVLWLLVLVGAVVGAMFAWLLFRQLTPQLEAVPHGFHYASVPALGALLLIATGISSFLAARQLGPRSLFEIGLGTAAAWGLVSALVLAQLTGGSYLFVWPFLGFVAGHLVSIAIEREDPSSARVAGALGIAALPAALLVAPVLELMLHALTLQLAIVLLGVGAIGISPLLPQLAVLGRRLGVSWSGGLVLVGGLALAWIGFSSKQDRETPRANNILYVAETGEQQAAWWSFDREVDAWTSELLEEEGGLRTLPEILPLSRGAQALSGPAPWLEFMPPAAMVTRDERADGGRQVEVEVRSERGAETIHLRASATVPISRVAIDGQGVDVGEGGLPELHIVYFGAPPEGFRVEMELPGRWPVEATVGDQSYGLGPTGVMPRPDGLIPSSSWWTDSVFVVTEVLF